MQAALLQETMTHTSYCSWRTRTLIWLLISFGVGTALLRSMQFDSHVGLQQPTLDMALLSQSYVGRAIGRSAGARAGGIEVFSRNSPVWLRGFANQQRRPLPALKPIDATAGGSQHEGSSKLRLMAQGDELVEPDAVQRLQSALKTAEDCVGECIVEWDNVEELSQAVEDAYSVEDIEGHKSDEQAQLSEADIDVIHATKEKLAAAREKMVKETGTVDEKVLKDISEGLKEVTKKISKERRENIEEALIAALDAALECSGDECVALWNEFDEVSKAKKKAESSSPAGTP